MIKKVAVVILNWNGQTFLEQFLPSVVRHSSEARIIVADNNSSDNSISFLQTNYPAVELIEMKENYGFAGGYNQALSQVDSEYYVLLNSDVEVTEDWLLPMIELLENDKSVAACQPKIKDYNRKDFFEYAGASGGFIDKYGYPFCRGRIFDTIEVDTNQYQSKNIFWASGACFFIRKEVFKQLNGFDESFFAHQEEIDLCWRAFNLNYKAKYVSGSTVYHVGGATLSAANPKKTYLNFRNSLFTLTKNAKGNLFLIILVRLILDGIPGLRFLLQLKSNNFLAVLKAHFSFYGKLKTLLRQRKNLTQQAGYFSIKSIVYQYFIKKRIFI